MYLYRSLPLLSCSSSLMVPNKGCDAHDTIATTSISNLCWRTSVALNSCHFVSAWQVMFAFNEKMTLSNVRYSSKQECTIHIHCVFTSIKSILYSNKIIEVSDLYEPIQPSPHESYWQHIVNGKLISGWRPCYVYKWHQQSIAPPPEYTVCI